MGAGHAAHGLIPDKLTGRPRWYGTLSAMALTVPQESLIRFCICEQVFSFIAERCTGAFPDEAQASKDVKDWLKIAQLDERGANANQLCNALTAKVNPARVIALRGVLYEVPDAAKPKHFGDKAFAAKHAETMPDLVREQVAHVVSTRGVGHTLKFLDALVRESDFVVAELEREAADKRSAAARDREAALKIAKQISSLPRVILNNDAKQDECIGHAEAFAAASVDAEAHDHARRAFTTLLASGAFASERRAATGDSRRVVLAPATFAADLTPRDAVRTGGLRQVLLGFRAVTMATADAQGVA